MKHTLFILLFFIFTRLFSQGGSENILKIGDKAPDFILTVGDNSIQSFIMPYMKRIILVHFWNKDNFTSQFYSKNLRQIYKRYRDATFSNAEGFEVICVAVQNDKTSWKEIVKSDSLGDFTNGIALKELNEDVCKKFNVKNLPTDILIDENGLIMSIDPRIVDLENLLDDKKNYQSVKRAVVGTFAESSDKKDVLKYSKIYLFNSYGDSVAKTITNGKGEFIFNDIKLNHDFILKVDNQSDIVTSDPLALYANNGDFLMDGRTRDGGFVFYIPTRLNYKLVRHDTSDFIHHEIEQIDVIKSLSFSNKGTELTPKDKEELSGIIAHLLKSKTLKLQFIVHGDIRLSAESAMELSVNEVNTLKNYLHSKGINQNRIKGVAMGKKEPRKFCEGSSDCTEEEFKLNRRIEFVVLKD